MRNQAYDEYYDEQDFWTSMGHRSFIYGPSTGSRYNKVEAYLTQTAENDEYDWEDQETNQAYADAMQYSEMAYLSLERFKGKRKGLSKGRLNKLATINRPYKGSKRQSSRPFQGSKTEKRSRRPYEGPKIRHVTPHSRPYIGSRDQYGLSSYEQPP